MFAFGISRSTKADLKALQPINGTLAIVLTDGKFWLGVTGQPVSTYVDNDSNVLVPVGGDGSAAWVKISEETVLDGYTGGGEYWVDGINGNDSNSGTQSEPFASLDRAFQVIGKIITKHTAIHLLPTSDVNGYSGFELYQPRVYNAPLQIIGEGSVDHTGNFTLTSFNSNGFSFDFSGSAPGWTNNEFIGKHLEFVSGTSGVLAGTKTTILANDTGLISGSGGMYTPSTFTGPAVGDVFKVTTPAVAIRIRNRDKISGGENFEGPLVPTKVQYRGLNLRNIELRADDNTSTTLYIVGGVYFDACTFTKNDPSANLYYIRFTDSSLLSGFTDPNDNESLKYYRSVISSYDRGSFNNSLFRFSFFNCFVIGGLCVGQTEFNQSRVAFYTSSRFDCIDISSGFPHGSIYVGKNSYVYTVGLSDLRIFSRDSERDIEVEHGMFELYIPLVHEGTGGFLRSRHKGQANIATNIINNGSGAGLAAWEGGRIRLININGSTMGDAVIGINFQTTRPAGAWAVGETLTSGDGSYIIRTA